MLFESISTGAAGSWQMTNLMPKMIAGDYAPGFFLKHLLKDLQIADQQEAGSLPVLSQIRAECAELRRAAWGTGNAGLIEYYRRK